MGFCCALGYLRRKGVKVKKVRLRLIFKNLKNTQPIKMNVIRRRVCKNRSAKAVWHLDSTHKLVEHKCAVSGSVDGFSHCIMWLKCSNNNRGNTSFDLFKEASNKCVTSLQFRGDKGSKNMLIAKHILMVHNTKHGGCVGSIFAHNTRIERFWREHNVNVVIHKP